MQKDCPMIQRDPPKNDENAKGPVRQLHFGASANAVLLNHPTSSPNQFSALTAGTNGDGSACAKFHNTAECEAMGQRVVDDKHKQSPITLQPKTVCSSANFQTKIREGVAELLRPAAESSGTITAVAYLLSPTTRKNAEKGQTFQRQKDETSYPISPQSQGIKRKTPSPTVRYSYPVGNEPLQSGSYSTKVIYRSLLADVIQPDNVKDFCKLLLIAAKSSTEAGEDQMVSKNEEVKQKDLAPGTVVSQSSSHHEETSDKLESDKAEILDEPSSINHREETQNPVVTDSQRQKTTQPGALALDSNERNTNFSNQHSVASDSKRPCNHDISHRFAEQEKIVLSEFRDCLLRIIDVGKKRAFQYSKQIAVARKNTLQTASNIQNGRSPGGNTICISSPVNSMPVRGNTNITPSLPNSENSKRYVCEQKAYV